MGESLVLWILAAVVLALLAWPLVRRRHSPAVKTTPATARRSAAGAGGEEDPAVMALREIELDRAMGKLSERDYETLRAKYQAELDARAAASRSTTSTEEMPREDVTHSLEERAETLVRYWRERRVECPQCGIRPEPGAIYCSNCGRRLAPCPSCGRPVAEPGARHCPHCGASLAA